MTDILLIIIVCINVIILIFVFSKNVNQKNDKEEIINTFKLLGESLSNNIRDLNSTSKTQLDNLSQELKYLTNINENKLDKMTKSIEQKLGDIQKDNNDKLEKMRLTVDEKLHKTLETRLNQSFQVVSKQLEIVHKDLGEMRHIASDVGDLKKVLTNVKTKGVLGEYQLENILEQLLTPYQYKKNVNTKGEGSNTVEFAIKLPGKDEKNPNSCIWLPIDSKFPTENYQLLLDNYNKGDLVGVEECRKNLKNTIKKFAKDINEKYLNPPNTTDFAIMFLPIEGLYAEVLNNVELFDILQREYKVIITGPTTLSALLNSLSMGFRTLAIEKRTSEVWQLLGAIKTEFGKFGDILDKTKQKIQEASSVIEKAGMKSRNIERKLKNVEELSTDESVKLLS